MDREFVSPPAYTPLLSNQPRYPSIVQRDVEEGYGATTGYQSGLPAGYRGDADYGSTDSVPLQPQIVIVGGCPACRVGVLDDHFTCIGILCAIFLFPIGILCCLATRQRRCSNCGAVFG